VQESPAGGPDAAAALERLRGFAWATVLDDPDRRHELAQPGGEHFDVARVEARRRQARVDLVRLDAVRDGVPEREVLARAPAKPRPGAPATTTTAAAVHVNVANLASDRLRVYERNAR